jgi:hypothetical protein
MALISDRVEQNLKRLVLDQRDFAEVFRDFKSLWTKKGITVVLDEADQVLFDEAVDEILKDRAISDNFSRRDIVDSLQDIVSSCGKVKHKTAKLKHELKELDKKLKSKIQYHTFLVPIANLEIPNKSRAFYVGDVKFFVFSKSRAAKWLRQFKKNIANTKSKKYLKDKSGKTYIAQTKKHFIEPLLGKTFAEVKSVGTERVAKRKAINRARLALSILKLYNLPQDDSFRRYFGIEGEVNAGTRRMIPRLYPQGGVDSITSEVIGYMDPFSIGKVRLEYMKKNGFRKVYNILKKHKRTNLEARILNAIYWYGSAFDVEVSKKEERDTTLEDILKAARESKPKDSIEEISLAERFVKLMISLETLLLNLPGKESSKTQNLSERVALLTPSKTNDKIYVKKLVKKLYSTRGSIVHEGETDITGLELDLLMRITQDTIFKLLSKKDRIRVNGHKVETNSDMYDWFERQKLS